MARRATRSSRRHTRPLDAETRLVGQHLAFVSFAIEYIDGIVSGRGDRFKNPLDVALTRVESIKSYDTLPAVSPPSTKQREEEFRRVLSLPLNEETRKFCLDVVLDEFHNTEVHRYFGRPVDPEHDDAPNYREVIHKPMDLGSVRTRLALSGSSNGAAQSSIESLDPSLREPYPTAGDVLDDILLTFDNAMNYNPPGHPVYEVARVTRDRMLAKFRTDIPGMPALEPESGSARPPSEDTTDRRMLEPNSPSIQPPETNAPSPQPQTSAAQEEPSNSQPQPSHEDVISVHDEQMEEEKSEEKAEEDEESSNQAETHVPLPFNLQEFDPHDVSQFDQLSRRLSHLVKFGDIYQQKVRQIAGDGQTTEIDLGRLSPEQLKSLWSYVAHSLNELGIDWNDPSFSPGETRQRTREVVYRTDEPEPQYEDFTGETVSAIGGGVDVPEQTLLSTSYSMFIPDDFIAGVPWAGINSEIETALAGRMSPSEALESLALQVQELMAETLPELMQRAQEYNSALKENQQLMARINESSQRISEECACCRSSCDLVLMRNSDTLRQLNAAHTALRTCQMLQAASGTGAALRSLCTHLAQMPEAQATQLSSESLANTGKIIDFVLDNRSQFLMIMKLGSTAFTAEARLSSQIIQTALVTLQKYLAMEIIPFIETKSAILPITAPLSHVLARISDIPSSFAPSASPSVFFAETLVLTLNEASYSFVVRLFQQIATIATAISAIMKRPAIEFLCAFQARFSENDVITVIDPLIQSQLARGELAPTAYLSSVHQATSPLLAAENAPNCFRTSIIYRIAEELVDGWFRSSLESTIQADAQTLQPLTPSTAPSLFIVMKQYSELRTIENLIQELCQANERDVIDAVLHRLGTTLHRICSLFSRSGSSDLQINIADAFQLEKDPARCHVIDTEIGILSRILDISLSLVRLVRDNYFSTQLAQLGSDLEARAATLLCLNILPSVLQLRQVTDRIETERLLSVLESWYTTLPTRCPINQWYQRAATEMLAQITDELPPEITRSFTQKMSQTLAKFGVIAGPKQELP